jgi:C4-dicarboxylate-specific signal transduction histidine kinase
MIGALFNISHRKQAEAQIQRLLEETQGHERELREKQAQLVQSAKMASIGELTTGVAHELNNPLNNIVLFIGNARELIERNLTGPLKWRLVANLLSATEQIERATTIVKHLRIFGRSRDIVQAVEINKVITSTLSFLSEKIRLADIQVTCALEPGNPLVQGARNQLEQVLVNMLTNAVDAMQAAPIRRLTLSTTSGNSHVEVRVEDTGTGIPPDLLPRIFDPFFTTKKVGEGTGLGLSIAYGIIKEHHGDITVQSVVGQGTQFLIRFPLWKESLPISKVQNQNSVTQGSPG